MAVSAIRFSLLGNGSSLDRSLGGIDPEASCLALFKGSKPVLNEVKDLS
jgi:hypothetical protein